MAIDEQQQTAMDEKVIEDAEFLAALETRQKRINSRNELARQAKEADEVVQGMIAKLDLGIGTAVRIGPYRIERDTRPAAYREFEVAEGVTTRIRFIAPKVTP